jgi:signal transduction histidine kinase
MTMEQSFPPARRNILLALLAIILILLPVFLLISPLIVSFAPQAARQSRLNHFLSTLLLTAVLLGLIYRYLAPIAQLGHLLRLKETPSPEVVQQAHQVAFSAPAYLFATLLGMTVLMTFLSNLVGLLFIPGYGFVPHFSEAPLIIAIATSTGVVLAVVARQQLKPVLGTTARLLARTDTSPPSAPGSADSAPPEKRRRFDVRSRLLIVILALSFAAYYFPGILAFNLVYQAVRTSALDGHRRWAEGVIQEMAPLLDDEALIHYVEETTLPNDGQAFIVDGQGRYVTRPPVPFALDPNEQATELLLPLERPEHDWQLGVAYQFRAESEPLIRRTLFLLLGFGLMTLAFTVLSALIVTADVSGELSQITRRLLEIGQREEVGAQLQVLSLDEMGDVVRAFNAVQAKTQARQEALQQEHQRLNRISTTLTSSLDASEILHMTVQHLVELGGVDYGSVLILERDKQHIRVVAEHPSGQLGNLRLSLAHLPSIQQALELGTPYAIQDAPNHPFLDYLQDQSPSPEFRSLLLVPLVARRATIGILLLASLDRHRPFSDEQIDVFQTVAGQAAVAVANARLLQDIQQHRRALSRKSQELTEASSKLDAILNNIADGLVVTDPTGRIILSNPAFRGMAGLPPTRPLQGRLLVESFPAARLQRLATRALEAPGQVFTENLKLPDSRVLKTSATALRIPPPILEPEQGEQVAGVVNVMRDITHEIEVDRMKTDFISAVSHELRSPLTAVLGFADLIQRDFRRWIAPRTTGDEEARRVAERILDNLSIIENQSRRLTQVINDVLDIAKIEAGRVEWPTDGTDLAEVIQKAIVATAALAEEKGLPIQTHLPPDGLPPVWGHPDRLVQVMTNLLSNAIKFTKQGQIQVSGCRLQVSKDGTTQLETVRAEPHDEALNLEPGTLSAGEWVVTSVADTGIGIPAEEIPRIFEKFTQVGDTLTGKPEGTGLGLSICKGIIEYYGGRIWVKSEPGKSSTFYFALPAASSQVPEEVGHTNAG